MKELSTIPVPVYVDFDDVLCETARGLIDVIDEHFGRSIEFEDIHSFDLALSFGLDEHELARLMEFAHTADILTAFAPVKGAVETLRDWAGRGARIWIVTGRPPLTEDASVEWLQRYGVPYERLIFVDKYGRFKADVHGAALTLDELSQLPFSLAIDDAPQMALYLSETMHVETVMLDRPWNRGIQLSGSVTRCFNWAEIALLLPSSGFMA